MSIIYEPEEKSQARSFLRQKFLEKESHHTENAEYQADHESAQGFEYVEVNEAWNVLCEEISGILERRGISVDEDYISDYLSVYANAKEDAEYSKKAEQAKADEDEFNLHLAKLTELQAALILLHIKYHYSFAKIGDLLGYSDQQADNFYQIAKDAFDSDDIQCMFFISHAISLETQEADLTGILIKNACSKKSNAGRPTKSQVRKNKMQNLAARVSKGDLLELGV